MKFSCRLSKHNGISEEQCLQRARIASCLWSIDELSNKA